MNAEGWTEGHRRCLIAVNEALDRAGPPPGVAEPAILAVETRATAEVDRVHVLGATMAGVASWLNTAGFGGDVEDALRETAETVRTRGSRSVAVVMVDLEGTVAFMALEVERAGVNTWTARRRWRA
jgi:hypothetical protein